MRFYEKHVEEITIKSFALTFMLAFLRIFSENFSAQMGSISNGL